MGVRMGLVRLLLNVLKTGSVARGLHAIPMVEKLELAQTRIIVELQVLERRVKFVVLQIGNVLNGQNVGKIILKQEDAKTQADVTIQMIRVQKPLNHVLTLLRI